MDTDTTPSAYIELGGEAAQGRRVLVDKSDFESLNRYRWSLVGGATPYAHACINGRRVRMHRFIMDAPKGMVVDHKNHDTLDNRRANLRVCTVRENSRNRRGVGVSWSAGRWQPQIKVDGAPLYLGSYNTRYEAELAYDAAARYYFGEFACTVHEGTDARPAEEIVKGSRQRPVIGSSKYRGVSRFRGRWLSFIRVNNKGFHLGLFDTELEAAHAFDAAAKERGLWKRMNFPDRK